MRHACQKSRGFTLIEMLISGVIIALVVGVCASVTVLSARSRVTDSSTDTTSLTLTARSGLDTIADDLKCANVITSKGTSSITFTVPDRDGDGVPEEISYYLSGGNLCRTYNSTALTPLITGCGTFALSYTDKAASLPTPVESSEQLLMSYTVTPNALTNLSTTSMECQYFNPVAVLPAKAVSWKITRVQLQLKRASLLSTGTVSIQIKAVDGSNKPVGSAIASATYNVILLPLTYSWVDIPLTTPAAELPPGTGMAIVVSSSTSNSNATIGGVIGISPVLTNMSECSTSNAGSSWATPVSNAALSFRVYGTTTSFP